MFQEKIGYLDWEFMVEEFPIEEGDPLPPQTGDASRPVFWAVVAICSLVLLIVLLVWRKKKQEKEETSIAQSETRRKA